MSDYDEIIKSEKVISSLLLEIGNAIDITDASEHTQDEIKEALITLLDSRHKLIMALSLMGYINCNIEYNPEQEGVKIKSIIEYVVPKTFTNGLGKQISTLLISFLPLIKDATLLNSIRKMFKNFNPDNLTDRETKIFVCGLYDLLNKKE